MYKEPYDEQEVLVSMIHPEMEFEAAYWSRKLGVTKAQLREVVARVGNRARDVRAAINTQGQLRAA